MAKRDDQKRKERELDLNMRWGDSKDDKNRDRVRDRGRSRSRSGERTPGLYVPFLFDTTFFPKTKWFFYAIDFFLDTEFFPIRKFLIQIFFTNKIFLVGFWNLHELQIQGMRRVQQLPYYTKHFSPHPHPHFKKEKRNGLVHMYQNHLRQRRFALPLGFPYFHSLGGYLVPPWSSEEEGKTPCKKI